MKRLANVIGRDKHEMKRGREIEAYGVAVKHSGLINSDFEARLVPWNGKNDSLKRATFEINTKFYS